ncbi:VUT family protein [Legionella worsleiensis]|nr:VUT family protein [Legionella worsleiensis]
MKQSLPVHHTSGFLFLAISVITCLLLLINVSFKIIIVQGLVCSISSLLCPLIAGIYLFILRHCTLREQRHILNISLMALYIYCIGVYVLVNLPAAEFMHDNPVYEIVFEDIPKKFFATTLSFLLSFYLPHLFWCTTKGTLLSAPQQSVTLAILGGVCFFTIDFYLLFSNPHAHSFKQIFIDSFMIASAVLLIIGVSYLSFTWHKKQPVSKQMNGHSNEPLPLYHYLLCCALAVLFMCLACEYRIVSLTKNCVLAASCIFFPITMTVSTVIGELWGYKAHLRLALTLIAAQLVFDVLLMGIVALPSPNFYDLNPFYNYILPRRVPAASLSLFVTFLSNAMLLHYLKRLRWQPSTAVRILIANIFANSLLCLVDYSVLFGGIYSYEHIMILVINVWQYKLLMTVISLPFILWLCHRLRKNSAPVYCALQNQIH